MKPVGMCRMCLVEIDTGRGPALQPACMIAVRRRHDGRHRVARSRRRPRTASSSSSSSTTRSTARCATRAASARCRTRRCAYGPGREPLRRGEAPLREADPDQRPRAPRPRALHPLRPLHPLRRARSPATRSSTSGPRQRDRGQHVPRPPVRLATSAATPCRSARSARSPPRPTASRPGPWDLDQVESHLHHLLGRLPRRSCSRAATRSCATRASTSTRSTGAGCATRAASASRPSTADDRLRDAAGPREGGELVAGRVGRRARRAAAGHPGRRSTASGPARSRVLGGARLTNEDAYAWAKLAKGVLGTDNVDAQLGDGLPGRGRARPAPGHHRRGLRARRHGAPPRPRPQGGAAGPLPAPAPRRASTTASRSSSWPRSAPASPTLAAATLLLPARRRRRASCGRCSPGRPTHEVGGVDARGHRGRRRRCWPTGRSPSSSAGPRWPSRRRRRRRGRRAIHDAHPDVRFLPRPAPRQRPRRPRHGPGARAAARAASRSTTARDWFARRGWADGARPSRASTPPASSQAAADGKIDVARAARRRPAGRLPRPRPGRRGRSPAPARSSPSTTSSPTRSQQADVVLPAAGSAEVDGTTTNLEGRVSTRRPEGHAARHRPGRLDDRRRARPACSAPTSGSSRSTQIWTRSRRVAPEPRRAHARRCSRPAAATASSCRSPTPPAPASRAVADAGVDPDAGEAAVAADRRRHRRRAAGRRGRGHRGAGRRRGRPPPAPPPTPPARLAVDVRADRRAAAGRRLLAAPGRHPQALRPGHRSSSSSPSLAGLAGDTALRLHPHDFDRLGVAAGDRRHASPRRPGTRHAAGRARRRRRPRARAAVALNQPGAAGRRARSTPTAAVTDVRVETAVIVLGARPAPRRRHRPRRSSLIVLLKVVDRLRAAARRRACS